LLGFVTEDGRAAGKALICRTFPQPASGAAVHPAGLPEAEDDVTDYWLNKLFFDLQQPELAARFKADREAVLKAYPMRADLRAAVLADDLKIISQHANAYLLRFYFAIRGVKDAEFIARLNALQSNGASNNG
jgi:hypothetical protein